MSSTTASRRRCQYPLCPTHKPGWKARIVAHTPFGVRRGSRKRLRCRTCGHTWSSRRGTIYHRMRHPKSLLDRAVRLQVEGMSKAGIARTLGVSPSTISRWIAKAADRAARFQEEHLRVEDPVEIQVDEVKSYGAGRESRTWVYNSIEVWSRMWLASMVGRRTLRSTLVLARSIKAACAPFWEPVLIVTDEFKYYRPTIAKTFGPLCVHVEVKNRYERGRITRSRKTLVHGPEWKLERARGRSEDSVKLNTSYVERLNLLTRRSISYLHRKTPAPMRNPHLLAGAVELTRCIYNFVRPHSSLKFGPVTRTPAMQAGLTKRPLTLREIFSWVPPPRRQLTPRVIDGWIP